MTTLRTGFNLFRNNILISSFRETKNQGYQVSLICVRNISKLQITKNLHLVSNEKKNFDRDNCLITTNDDRPLVVMLTWLLAKQKHIMKFNKLYLEQGFDVLNVSVTPWQILWPRKGTQLVGRDIVRFLDKNHHYSPLLLHGFSVGGYVWAEALVQLIQDKRYQHVIERIVGQIWDSAADITEIPVGFPKAVFPNNTVLETALRQYILYHMKAFHNVATCHYLRASQIFHTTRVAPALFLLSKSDPVGAFSSNMGVRESWESLGLDVYWKCWDKSPHVSHLYYHPKEYMQELSDFLEKLELINSPGKMQMKI